MHMPPLSIHTAGRVYSHSVMLNRYFKHILPAVASGMDCRLHDRGSNPVASKIFCMIFFSTFLKLILRSGEIGR